MLRGNGCSMTWQAGGAEQQADAAAVAVGAVSRNVGDCDRGEVGATGQTGRMVRAGCLGTIGCRLEGLGKALLEGMGHHRAAADYAARQRVVQRCPDRQTQHDVMDDVPKLHWLVIIDSLAEFAIPERISRISRLLFVEYCTEI